jgi:Glutaredoxin and related proteins
MKEDIIKSAIIYSVPGCPRCDHAKNALTALSYNVIERDGEALARGEIRDTEAMTELMITEAYPVVIVDGRAVRKGDDLYNLIQEHKEW